MKYQLRKRRLKIEKFTDVCMTGGTKYIFSADITPEMLKLCRVTKVKAFFLVLVYVFNLDLFEFSAAILEKGLLQHSVKFSSLNIG